MKRITIVCSFLTLYGSLAWSQDYQQRFEQLGTMLPTPNTYRTASGSPGHEYWQQRADYQIKVTLDDAKQVISGSETITYTNNAPDVLGYLWVQLDQNMRDEDSDTYKARTTRIRDGLSAKSLQTISGDYKYDGGYKIDQVTDLDGNDLAYTINKTMMRVELPKTLGTGDKFSFKIAWSYNINDRMLVGGRSGYEFFPEDGNYVYTIAQWFPRMAVYDDVNGWQNKQFLGQGEFALPFGDYQVEITVPADHVVAATGTLNNPKEVLSKDTYQKFLDAKNASEPVIVVSEREAISKEINPVISSTSTWKFSAKNVRDFAFASSRKFIWDAQGVQIGDHRPLAMSFYPKEGNPLWEKHSTEAVVKTLQTYSKYTIDYPYPVAISVHAASIGMEYPMICFNFGRPEPDGTYTDQVKYNMISVIIHEVGHNFFPMIINSDERQWTWMDEGLNTFVQYRTQVEQYENFPSRRGPATSIVPYMKGDKSFIRPIMTNSEQILQFGNNAYGKPAAALSILRETVMGPELFDYAFKEYARRWAFKHPTPADFFRTMEDASAVDLDWFWRGWFYSTDHVDMGIDQVKWYRVKQSEETVEGQLTNEKKKAAGGGGNEGSTEPTDFEEVYSEFVVVPTDSQLYGEFLNRVDDNGIVEDHMDKNFYEITFSNDGGLVSPIIVEFTYKDGTTEVQKIPAEIWRLNEEKATKVFVTSKEVVNINLDPNKETADTEDENNVFPKRDVKSKFEKFKEREE
ncbi:MAG: aminopeptidase [Cyclobacteriaceae bacterium]|nr:MAG: aminopeptidase [Cyclobacteriaceae bacterium]